MKNKPQKEKSISRVVLWNVAGRFVLQGIAFFSAPIFTRLLPPADYGRVAIYNAWMGIFTLFVGLQTYGSIANAKIKYDENEIDGYLSAAMTLSLASFLVVLFFITLFNKQVSDILSLRRDFVFLLVGQSFFAFVVNFHTTKWMQFKEVEKNMLLSFLVSISSIVLSVIFIFMMSVDNKYAGKIYGMAIPQFGFGAVFLYIIYKKGKVFYNKSYWNFCLALTLPLIFHGAGGVILSQSDRVMLEKIVGEEAAGIYSLGYSFALAIATIWGAFNTSWVPFYYDYKKNNRADLILQRSKNYMFVFSCLTIGFILVVPEVYKVMTPNNYWSGIRLMPLIALAYYFNFLYSFPGNHEFFHQKTIYISIGTLAAAAVNVTLNALLIPIYGMIGAALATVIAYGFLFLFHDIIARFIVKNFEYGFDFYVKGLLPVSMAALLYYFTLDYWIIRWGLGLMLGAYLVHRVIKNKAIF